MNIEEAIEKAKEFINYLPMGARIISFRKGQFIDCQIAIETLLTAYEKEKEKNKELTERVLKLESDKFWDNVVSKSKIKQIIYPTPENPIPIEVQQSEMYKKLLKEVEE